MRKPGFRIIAGLIILAVLLMRTDLLAAPDMRADAINKAFAQAQDLAADEAMNNPEQKYRQILGQAVTVEQEPMPQEVDAYVRFMPASGAKSMPGGISLVDSEAEYSYNTKLFGQLPLAMGVITSYTGINNTTPVDLPSRLTGISFGFETTFPFFNVKDTYFRVGVAPSFYGDRWNINSSNFRIPSRLFWIYQPDPKLVLIAGVAVSVDYSEAFFPILGAIYKPNERLAFNIIPPRPTITYALDDKWTAFAEAGMKADEYAVSAYGQKSTILQYNDMRAGAGISYSVNKHVDASLSAGMVFSRYLRYRQDCYPKVSLDNGPYTEFRVEIGM
jgi:hypothetical protein